MVSSIKKLKNLKIEVETHKRLADYGRKSETFDDTINRLLDEVEERAKR